MLKTYKIVFTTEEDGQYTLNISGINNTLTDSEVAVAVNKMVASKAVFTSTGYLSIIKSISRIGTTATKLDVA